jgi:hypothetical protein
VSWPANQFAGNIPRQRADRASFLNRLFANRRPARLQPECPSRATREYGATFPFQQFGQVARVNQPAEIQASSRFVSHAARTQRPNPLIGGAK